MLRLARLIAFLCVLGALPAAEALATPFNKCVLDGKVTYQQAPCPSGTVRKPPTVDELNAREAQRRAAAANAPTGTAASPAATAPAAAAERPMPALQKAASPFACDGRQHCSQMRSCAEAKFFLARCPGVKMDGDGDGIPCEEQWCRL